MTTTLLRKVSIGYLLLPNLLFFFYWYQIQYSLPILIGLGYLFWLELKKKSTPADLFLSFRELDAIVAVCLLWVSLSGVGKLSYQTIDHLAHDTKYYELFNSDWPLYYPQHGQYACYFYAYYLVPAFISKLLGELSVGVMVVWTTVGFALGVAWLYLLLNKKAVYVWLILCFGGIGHLLKTFIYRFVIHHEFHTIPFLVEIWSILEQSFWVPNQVIPSMIVGSILIFDAFYEDKFEVSFFPLTLIFTWAVFPAMVLVLVFGIIAIKHFVNTPNRLFNNRFAIYYLLPGIFFLPVFIYFLSSGGGGISGLIWQFEPTADIALEYIIEVGFDMIVYLLLTYVLRSYFSPIPLWFIYSVYALFLAMSQYRIGLLNDWFIRGIIPLLCIMGICLLRAIQAYWHTARNLKGIFLIFSLLLLGTVVPIAHLWRGLQTNVITKQLFPQEVEWEQIRYDKYPTILDMLEHKWGVVAREEYLGKADSFYHRYLAKLPSKQNSSEKEP